MRCPICENKEWKSADQFRIKPEGMMYCTKCAFVTYPDRVKQKNELVEYYEGDDYRRPPTFGNLSTGQTKLQYHALHLKDVFKEWKEKDIKEPVIVDVGTAFGLFLAWVKKVLPSAKLHGTELTQSFRRVAKHEYGLDLVEYIDESLKYDLISSYKVLEHMPDPDLELKKYNKLLNDDGFLYISVPVWYEVLVNFGMPGFSLEYYLHPDHINVWSKKMFEKILHEAGFTIIKEDHLTYDSTYVCKKTKDIEKIELDPPEYILDCLDRIKKSSDLITKHKHEEALKLWPANPTAHHGNYEMRRKEFDIKGFDYIKKEIIEPALISCKNHSDVIGFAADLHMRYDDYINAIEFFKIGLSIRPNFEPYLKGLCICMEKISERNNNPKEKRRLYKEAADLLRRRKSTCLGAMADSITHLFQILAKIPTDKELEKK